MARTLPAYVTTAKLRTHLTAQWLAEASDDDGDGTGEYEQSLCDEGSDWVDSYLQGRYPLPVVDAGAFAKLEQPAMVRALWVAFQRRGRHGENNPWEEELKRWAKKLEAIERGDIPLLTPAASGEETVAPPAKIGVNKRPLRTASRYGANAV